MVHILQFFVLPHNKIYEKATNNEKKEQRDLLLRCLATKTHFPKSPYEEVDKALEVFFEAFGMEKPTIKEKTIFLHYALKKTDPKSVKAYNLDLVGKNKTSEGDDPDLSINRNQHIVPVKVRKNTATKNFTYTPVNVNFRGRRYLTGRLPWLQSWPVETMEFSHRLLKAVFEACGYSTELGKGELAVLDLQCEMLESTRKMYMCYKHATPEKLQDFYEDILKATNIHHYGYMNDENYLASDEED